MCEELNKELKKGEEAAELLVKHLENMGASQMKIPVFSNGVEYIVCVLNRDSDNNKKQILNVLDKNLNNYWNTISDTGKAIIADEILKLFYTNRKEIICQSNH